MRLAIQVLQHGRVSPTTGAPMSGVMLANRTLIEATAALATALAAAAAPGGGPAGGGGGADHRDLRSLGDLSDLSERVGPLTVSAACNNVSALKRAVRDKAAQHDPNRRDPDGERTPLHWAAARGHSRCAVVLLKAGADPAQAERSSGLSCARLAAAHGHEKLATLLERHRQQQQQQQQQQSSAPPTPEGMRSRRRVTPTPDREGQP